MQCHECPVWTNVQSIEGNIITNKRNCLKPENVERLFLSNNLWSWTFVFVQIYFNSELGLKYITIIQNEVIMKNLHVYTHVRMFVYLAYNCWDVIIGSSRYLQKEHYFFYLTKGI